MLPILRRFLYKRNSEFYTIKDKQQTSNQFQCACSLYCGAVDALIVSYKLNRIKKSIAFLTFVETKYVLKVPYDRYVFKILLL